jgi:hypothetical protein
MRIEVSFDVVCNIYRLIRSANNWFIPPKQTYTTRTKLSDWFSLTNMSFAYIHILKHFRGKSFRKQIHFSVFVEKVQTVNTKRAIKWVNKCEKTSWFGKCVYSESEYKSSFFISNYIISCCLETDCKGPASCSCHSEAHHAAAVPVKYVLAHELPSISRSNETALLQIVKLIIEHCSVACRRCITDCMLVLSPCSADTLGSNVQNAVPNSISTVNALVPTGSSYLGHNWIYPL